MAPSIPYSSVCSGHEAVTQALQGRGWEPSFFAEVEAFPCAVLGQRFGATAPRHPLDPEGLPAAERATWRANNKELARMAKCSFGNKVPNLGDFTKIDPAEWAAVQWLWGGTPCQDFSVAGLRLGLEGHRGNLTLAFLALAHELAATGSLRGFTWENVPGILSHKRNAFGCFLGAAVGHDAPIVSPHRKGRWTDAGVASGPLARAAWRVLDTQHFGLPQRRRRVFVILCFGDGPDPVEILFERQGVPGAAAPRSGPGQGVTYDLAPSLTASGRGVERIGETRGQDPVVNGDSDDGVLSPKLYSAMPMNSGRDFTDREVPVAQPLMAAGPGLGDQGGDYVLEPIIFDGQNLNSTDGSGISPTLDTGGSHLNRGLHVMQPSVHAPALAITLKAEGFDASEDGTGRQTLVDHKGLAPLAFGGNNTSGPIEVATARSAHAGPHGRLDFETETFVAEPIPIIADAVLDGSAKTLSPDAEGRMRLRDSGLGIGDEGDPMFTLQTGTPHAVMAPIPFDTTQITSAANRSQQQADDTGHPLVAAGHPPAIAFNSREDLIHSAEDFGALGSSLPQAQAVAFSLRGREGENQVEPEVDDVAPALRTGEGGSSKSFVAQALPILEPGKRTGKSTTDVRAGIGIGEPGDPMYTLQAGAQHAVGVLAGSIRWAVRRLTPVECERLQGTADNFTRIRWRGRPEEECPDGPRYKVIGNAMSVDVIVWLGDRIRKTLVA